MLDSGENCDDGNVTSGDCCSATCQTENLKTVTCGVGGCAHTVQRCVNGVPQACTPGSPGTEGPEGDPTCTNGIDDDCDGATDAADTDCQPRCGNGVLDVGEQCDDGNTVSGDGCSPTCQSELIPGSGLSRTDCMQEWSAALVPARDSGGLPLNRQQCTVDDPTCDATLADNACTFRLKLCFNVTERRLSCTPADIARVQFTADSISRGALEAALTGLGGSVRGQCTNHGSKHGQVCGADANCDTSAGSADGVCGHRFVVFQPPLTAIDRCTDFASITVPLRQTRSGFKRRMKTLRLTASPSNDPVTGRQRAKDKDTLKLVCNPHP